jgi:hypothetical protein
MRLHDLRDLVAYNGKRRWLLSILSLLGHKETKTKRSTSAVRILESVEASAELRQPTRWPRTPHSISRSFSHYGPLDVLSGDVIRKVGSPLASQSPLSAVPTTS